MTNTIQSVSVQSKFNGKVHRLNKKNAEELLIKRGLNPDWVMASCSSIDIPEASELLGYTAHSPGILIEGANGQSQFKPNQPWASQQGQKAPKYRTILGDEYDALLPKHPTDPNYWLDIKKLKEQCYQINGQPMLLITEGGFKAIATCSHALPTIALLGVEMQQFSFWKK
jgi:putative DNA primase/helicase